MATSTTAAGAAGSAVASAVGVDPSVGQAVGSAGGSSGLCNCCCGNASAAGQQAAAINAANPPTGNPAVDNAPGGANPTNAAALQTWQTAQDVSAFNALPAAQQAMLPDVVAFANQLKSEIPASDMNLTLAQAVQKYPQLAATAYQQIQQMFPDIANVPLTTAMALASASGLDQTPLSQFDTRLTQLVAADPTAQAIMNKSGVSVTPTQANPWLVWGALGVGAVLLAKKLAGR